MQLHNLKSGSKKKNVKRVGRGGKRGTYSGKGQKGQRSRAGKRFKPVIRELIKRYPKLKGTRQRAASQKPVIVKLDVLEKKLKKGSTVTPFVLVEQKIISKVGSRFPEVKILSTGKITKALNFEKCLVSKEARKKIEAVGGKIK